MGWVMGEPVLGGPLSCCRSHRDEGLDRSERLGDYTRHLQSRGEPPPSAWIDDETNTGSFSLNLFDHRAEPKLYSFIRKCARRLTRHQP